MTKLTVFFEIVRTRLKMLKSCGRLGYDIVYFGMRFPTFQSNVLLPPLTYNSDRATFAWNVDTHVPGYMVCVCVSVLLNEAFSYWDYTTALRRDSEDHSVNFQWRGDYKSYISK